VLKIWRNLQLNLIESTQQTSFFILECSQQIKIISMHNRSGIIITKFMMDSNNPLIKIQLRSTRPGVAKMRPSNLFLQLMELFVIGKQHFNNKKMQNFSRNVWFSLNKHKKLSQKGNQLSNNFLLGRISNY